MLQMLVLKHQNFSHKTNFYGKLYQNKFDLIHSMYYSYNHIYQQMHIIGLQVIHKF